MNLFTKRKIIMKEHFSKEKEKQEVNGSGGGLSGGFKMFDYLSKSVGVVERRREIL